MASHHLLSALILLAIADQCLGSLCSASYGLSYYYMYCSDGCCGYYYDRTCCVFDLAGGAIAGIVIGSLIGLALLVSLIVCIICVFCRKGRGQPGTVMQPNQNVTVVSSTSQVAGQSYPQYQYPAATVGSQGAVQYNTGFAQPPPAYK